MATSFVMMCQSVLDITTNEHLGSEQFLTAQQFLGWFPESTTKARTTYSRKLF